MIIGLTGSIASGKSTVSQMLKELGYPIVDADLVARQVVEPGSETLEKIKGAFGEDVILPNGSLDRKKVGDLIFTDPASRKRLNDIIHPAIRNEMLRQRADYMAEGQKVVIMDIPLLFESKLQHFVDKILVVSVTEENQLKRLMERNELVEGEALARISSQLPMSVKEEGADAVIYNNGTIEETKWQLNRILEEWDAGISEQ
ncbi:dephospho-CoA kinase [Planomicrobium koreense]|uniref:Dephospho-CoA kinase n=1 Tax=Planococcus koreensis TaxID=112331 RepID=A0A7W8FUJ0_9BACL|nr:dephospho-CoA kinase [Planococcus koreensis]MBB5180655.1 dephospho-CoA kinase [Planococcus koreensis]